MWAVLQTFALLYNVLIALLFEKSYEQEIIVVFSAVYALQKQSKKDNNLMYLDSV